MKKFIYTVNGSDFTDNTAFGSEYKKAIEKAKAEHASVTRMVVKDDSIKYEFLAKGGMFIDERFFEKDKVYKF